MSDDPAEREMVLARLQELDRLAHERKNPLYAWQAFLWCRTHDFPMPEWIMRHLTWVAISLLTLAARSGGIGETELSEALGVPTTEGGKPIASRRLNGTEAAELVKSALGLSGKEGNAFQNLARDVRAKREAGIILLAQHQPDDWPEPDPLTEIAKLGGLPDRALDPTVRSARKRRQRLKSVTK